MTKVQIVHHTTGRTRIVVHPPQASKSFYAEIRSKLETHPSIRSIEHRPLTGSLILFHDLAMEELIKLLEATFSIRVAVAIAGQTRLGRSLEKSIVDEDRKILRHTGGRFDILEGVVLLVFGVWVIGYFHSLS